MTRRAFWLAWSLCALSLALTSLSLLLFDLNLSHPSTHVYDYWLENTIVAISYAPIGALVASRRPENPVGWLMCLYGLATTVGHFGSQYAIYSSSAQPGVLPAGETLAWTASWILPIIIGFQVFSYLLFPTGRLPSGRWRWVAWLTVAFVVAGVLSSAFSFGANTGLGSVQNPLGRAGFSSYYDAVMWLLPLLYVAVASSLFVRLRRAVEVERQQVKWFAYAAAATIVGVIVAYMIPDTIDTPLWFERAGFALNVAVTPAIPVAIGIAILRYGLYDIDLLINRTLVYGALTALLALVYFGGVTAVQSILQTFTGREELPQLATVVSTLVIAALFSPLRRRVQSFIDRSFYRGKYDARKTLETFANRLRDETDLNGLREDLVGVVRETVQPTHISVWLRSPNQTYRREESPG